MDWTGTVSMEMERGRKLGSGLSGRAMGQMDALDKQDTEIKVVN